LEKTDKHSEYIAHLIQTLSDESMSSIDFDHLKVRLGEIGKELALHQDLQEQLQLLRDDYTQRIAGMIKAMAALERKTDAWGDALSLVDSLSSMGASELVDCYRRTAARFRDSFPASFGLLHQPRQCFTGSRDLSVYK